MKYLILLFCHLLFVHSNPLVLHKLEKCECFALLKTECGNQFECKWTGAACETKACTDYTTEDKCTGTCKWSGNKCIVGKKTCSDMPTEESCSNMAQCGWKNNSCSSFSQCKDYTVSKPERCNVLVGTFGERCQSKNSTVVATGKQAKHLVTATVTTTAQTQCEDKVYVDCSKFTTQATCKGDASAQSQCQWKSDGKCYAFKLNYCSDASGFNSALCDPQFCKSGGVLCLNKACEDFTTQATCTTLPLISKNFAVLCQWANNKCTTPSDVSFLTSPTCNTATLGTYRWVSNSTTNSTTNSTAVAPTDAGSCKQCVAQILSIILIVMAFVIL